MQNRQLIFSPRKPYDLVAERSEATAPCLQFPVWWSILKVVYGERKRAGVAQW